MMLKFCNEWKAFLEVVEIVCCGDVEDEEAEWEEAKGEGKENE